MIIKICGMREPENIRLVNALGVDMIGLIFYPESPRYVSMSSSGAGILPDYPGDAFRQKDLLSQNSGKAKLVGVFVDDMPQNIVTRVYNYYLDFVQLHGGESPIYIENLRRTLDPDIRPGIKIIKAFSIASTEDLLKVKPYEGLADIFLFDTKCEEKGGCGRKFDWSLLELYQGDTPFILSGGIGPDDAACIKAFRHPRFIGIDLNSRFETEPGMKDVVLIRTFLQKLLG